MRTQHILRTRCCDRHNANPYVRDKLGRRAGDSLCGAGHHGTGGGGTAANKAFLETRALLAEARARHATKPGGGRESSAGAMDGVTESIVDDSERDEEGGGAFFNCTGATRGQGAEQGLRS